MRKHMSKPHREKLRGLLSELAAAYPPATLRREVEKLLNPPRRKPRQLPHSGEQRFRWDQLCAQLLETNTAKEAARFLGIYKPETIEKRARRFKTLILDKLPPEDAARWREQQQGLHLPKPIRNGKWHLVWRRPGSSK